MEMPASGVRIEYTVSREDYIAGLRAASQLLLRSVRWGGLMYCLTAASVACGIFIGMGYVELINGYIGRNWRLQWFIAVAFLLICLLTIWQQRLRVARIHAACAADDNWQLGAQALTVTDEGLIHETSNALASMSWATLKQVADDGSKFLIIFNNYSFWVVPGTAFADAASRIAWVDALRARMSAPIEVVPANAPTVTPDVMADVTMDATQAAPLAPVHALGLRENLRAGARLAFLRRVPLDAFVATAEAFTLLVALELLLLLAYGVASVGFDGEFNHHALPRALLVVPAALLLGVFVARATSDRSMMLALPVALMSAGLLISAVGALAGFALEHKIIMVASTYWAWLFYFQIAWWSAIILVAVWRYTPMQRQRSAGMGMMGIALLVAPSVWFPPERLWIPAHDAETQRIEAQKRQALADEKGFYAQHDALPRALSALLPERPGVIDVYALTAGLYASEDVFMKEARLIDALMRQRFDAQGRSLVLLNNPATVQEFPLASATSLALALKHIGGLMSRDEDVLMMYLSSHGSERHDLTVNFWPLRLQPVNPATLKQALDASNIKWKVLVVSACYSGGFIEPLKDDHTLIITASSAIKTSFGCGNESEATYLARALYDEALRETHSFEAAFETARGAIRAREQAQKFEPSEPQIFVGAAMRDKLRQLEERLSRGEPQTGPK